MPLYWPLLYDSLLIFFILCLPVLRLHSIVKHRQYTISIRFPLPVVLKSSNCFRFGECTSLMFVAEYCSLPQTTSTSFDNLQQAFNERYKTPNIMKFRSAKKIQSATTLSDPRLYLMSKSNSWIASDQRNNLALSGHSLGCTGVGCGHRPH